MQFVAGHIPTMHIQQLIPASIKNNSSTGNSSLLCVGQIYMLTISLVRKRFSFVHEIALLSGIYRLSQRHKFLLLVSIHL